jgi:hypothetical protein
MDRSAISEMADRDVFSNSRIERQKLLRRIEVRLNPAKYQNAIVMR